MFKVSSDKKRQKPTIKKRIKFILTKVYSHVTSSVDTENSRSLINEKSISMSEKFPKVTGAIIKESTIKTDLLIHPKEINKKVRFRLYRENLIKRRKEKIQIEKKIRKNKKINKTKDSSGICLNLTDTKFIFENDFNSKGLRNNFNNLINMNKSEDNIVDGEEEDIEERTNNNKNSFNSFIAGRWKREEHQRFVEAIIKYGNNWNMIQKCVGTRSSTQARSHAQKFFEKLKKRRIFSFSLDFSKESLEKLQDLVQNKSTEDAKFIYKTLYNIPFENCSSSKRNNNYSIDNNINNLENHNIPKKSRKKSSFQKEENEKPENIFEENEIRRRESSFNNNLFQPNFNLGCSSFDFKPQINQRKDSGYYSLRKFSNYRNGNSFDSVEGNQFLDFHNNINNNNNTNFNNINYNNNYNNLISNNSPFQLTKIEKEDQMLGFNKPFTLNNNEEIFSPLSFLEQKEDGNYVINNSEI